MSTLCFRSLAADERARGACESGALIGYHGFRGAMPQGEGERRNGADSTPPLFIARVRANTGMMRAALNAFSIRTSYRPPAIFLHVVTF